LTAAKAARENDPLSMSAASSGGVVSASHRYDGADWFGRFAIWRCVMVISRHAVQVATS
jgi:hypothetical protein